MGLRIKEAWIQREDDEERIERMLRVAQRNQHYKWNILWMVLYVTKILNEM
jgi:hypothetical protein